MQDRAVWIRRIDVGEVLGDCAARDGEAVAVHETRIEQRAHDHWHAAHSVNVTHDVTAERLDVGEQRHLGADAMEVIHREVDVRLVCKRE